MLQQLDSSSISVAEAHPLSTLSPSDLVIAIMGITGSGKSTLISKLAEQDVGIGHELTSCTTYIGIYSFVYQNTRRVYLIDTPGFDDTHRSDTEVLKDIAFFLSQTYKQTVKLAGIVYLHRITDVRVSGSALKNLNMFKQLCGEDAFKHAVLATTMWGNLTGPTLSYDTGVKREQQLISTEGFWGDMFERGSRVERWTGERDSALSIVAHLIELHDRVGKAVLQIRKELVDETRDLEETSAGQEVDRELNAAKKRYRTDIDNLQASYDQAKQDHNERLAQSVLRQKKDFERKIREANTAQAELRTSMERLAAEKTAEYNRLLQKFQDEQEKIAKTLQDQERKCQRLVDERERDAELHRESLAQHQTDIATWERKYQENIAHSHEKETEMFRRQREDMDKMQQKFDEQFKQEKLRNEQRTQQVKARMELVRLEEERQRKASVLIPLVRVLAGVGVAAIGMATKNSALMAGGVALLGSNLS